MNKGIKGLALLLTLMLLPSSLLAQEPAAGIPKAVQYLQSMQQPDGGFAARTGGGSSQNATTWATMALSAAGQDARSGLWQKSQGNPVTYLQKTPLSLDVTTDVARTMMALASQGVQAQVQGRDLTAWLKKQQQPDGQFGQILKGETGMVNAHMWSILALASVGERPQNEAGALNWLIQAQNSDGGFGWHVEMDSDPDDTAIAVMALSVFESGSQRDRALTLALSYLKKQRLSDGGYAWSGQSGNSATDAWVAQALMALGEKTDELLAHLSRYQTEQGWFMWTQQKASAPVTMTSYSIMALAGQPFPVKGSFKAPSQADLILYLQQTRAWFHGQPIEMDVAPILFEGRTLVPLRAIGEGLGAQVIWHDAQKKVEMRHSGKQLELVVGQPLAGLSQGAQIVGGRVMVPLRYVAEAFQAEVNWLALERRVDIVL